MTCSPARMMANRQNAARSTGPRTMAGKVAARLNAFRHGLAGAGDLLGPEDDARVVAERSAAFVRELGVEDEVGRTLARRAALLATRMERAAEREGVAVAARVAAAHDEFDQARIDRVSEPYEALAAGDDPLGAIGLLGESPEGVMLLIDAWLSLGEEIGSDDPERARAAVGRASAWLGMAGGDVAPIASEWAARVAGEVARWRGVLAMLEPVTRAVAAARVEAGVLARFDPSPEATLARRYEAAAERGMYRALRAVAEVRSTQRSVAPVLGEAVRPTRPPEPALARLVPPAEPDSLGSFRIGVIAGRAPSVEARDRRSEPASFHEPERKQRPDLRKLDRNRR